MVIDKQPITLFSLVTFWRDLLNKNRFKDRSQTPVARGAAPSLAYDGHDTGLHAIDGTAAVATTKKSNTCRADRLRY